MTPGSTDPERYGQTRVAKIRAAYNDLRVAIRSGDMAAAEKALDRYESWADYVFDTRHNEPVGTAKVKSLTLYFVGLGTRIKDGFCVPHVDGTFPIRPDLLKHERMPPERR